MYRRLEGLARRLNELAEEAIAEAYHSPHEISLELNGMAHRMMAFSEAIQREYVEPNSTYYIGRVKTTGTGGFAIGDVLISPGDGVAKRAEGLFIVFMQDKLLPTIGDRVKVRGMRQGCLIYAGEWTEAE